MAIQDEKPTIGFIGHGYVGKSYADNFAERGYPTIRYALEEPWVANKEKIGTCDIVMIAVPTPTTPKGFMIDIVEEALSLVKPGAIVVMKSTMPPGQTAKLQKKFPKITLLFSPEFLSVATAAQDASHPFATVVGIPVDDEKHREAAEKILKILPYAPHQLICTSEEAEIYKYSHNIGGVMQILTFNLMYDISQKFGCDWEKIQRAIEADPYIPNRYSTPVNKGGRGAGGGCFIKDLAAYKDFYKAITKSKEGTAFLEAAEKMNISLLVSTKKDVHLLEGVYGKKVLKSKKVKKSR